MVRARWLFHDYRQILPDFKGRSALEELDDAKPAPRNLIKGVDPEAEQADTYAAQLYREVNEEALQARLKKGSAEDHYYKCLLM